MQEAALRHLARFATTEAGLTGVLSRKIDRWARSPAANAWADSQGGDLPGDVIAAAAAAARASIPTIVAGLAQSGAVNDETFANSRSRSLTRAGRSRRAVGAHLAQKGVSQTMVAAATPADATSEFAAAVIHARKRRLGPFNTISVAAGAEPAARRRALASFARAGFSKAVASRVLALPRDIAEDMINAFRATL